MKLYTKTGDDGSTGLLAGQRVLKDSLRIETCGAVDELNSHIGLAAAACGHKPLSAVLSDLQDHLFDLGAELATPANKSAFRIGPDHVAQAERHIDAICKKVPPLQHFIQPGGCELAARLHVGRSVCRRAERRCVSLSRQEAVNGQALVYLNRLSDLLFAAARWANQLEVVDDVLWNPEDR